MLSSYESVQSMRHFIMSPLRESRSGESESVSLGGKNGQRRVMERNEANEQVGQDDTCRVVGDNSGNVYLAGLASFDIRKSCRDIVFFVPEYSDWHFVLQ
jgi:hypothetical protein